MKYLFAVSMALQSFWAPVDKDKCPAILSQPNLLQIVKDSAEVLDPPMAVDAVYLSPGMALRKAADAADRRENLSWRVHQVAECSK